MSKKRDGFDLGDGWTLVLIVLAIVGFFCLGGKVVKFSKKVNANYVFVKRLMDESPKSFYSNRRIPDFVRRDDLSAVEECIDERINLLEKRVEEIQSHKIFTKR